MRKNLNQIEEIIRPKLVAECDSLNHLFYDPIVIPAPELNLRMVRIRNEILNLFSTGSISRYNHTIRGMGKHAHLIFIDPLLSDTLNVQLYFDAKFTRNQRR